jgi:hypothetical protein
MEVVAAPAVRAKPGDRSSQSHEFILPAHLGVKGEEPPTKKGPAGLSIQR